MKDFPISNADFLDLRNGAKSAFEDFGAVTTGRGPLPQADGTPEQVRFGVVSTNFLPMLGAPELSSAAISRTPTACRNRQYRKPVLRRVGRRLNNFPHSRSSATGISSGASVGMLRSWPRLPVPGVQGPIVVGVLAPGFELLFPPDANVEQFPDAWFAERIPYDTANRIMSVGALSAG